MAEMGSAGGPLPAAHPNVSRAKRMLVGRDGETVAPEQGVALIEAAAESGDSDALCVLATLRAAGAWTHHSWSGSLDLLQKAAELGSTDARTQLCLLAEDAELATHIRIGRMRDSDRWARLRGSIDPEKWTMTSPPVQICDSPRVWVTEDFARPDLCEWLVTRAAERFKPALMRDGRGESHALATRTCTDFVFDIVDGGVVMLLLRIKISNCASLPTPFMEPPQIFHYAIGEEIKAHYDFVYDGQRPYGRDGAYTGDRLATFLLYLNDGYEGGELEFPHGRRRWKGKAGDGILFASYRDGKPDRASLHAATPVRRGEKFILSQWIHDRPFGG